MRTEPEIHIDEDSDRAREEVARVAKQLAEYGFYVMGSLLPDEMRTRPAQTTKWPN